MKTAPFTRLCHGCLVLILAAAVIAAPLAAPARAEEPAQSLPAKEETAVNVIERVTRDVLTILASKDLPAEDRRKRIREIAFTHIDFDALSRLALGRTWRELSDAQRADFTKEYRTHLANTYRSMIDNYTDETIKIVGEREEPRGDRTVMTKVIDPKTKEDFKVDYRLRKQKDVWRIIDITIEGVSLAANFRAQFQEILDNGGFERLMKMLREKNAAAESEPEKKK